MASSQFSRELRAVIAPRSSAELVTAGTSYGRLQGPRWRRTTYGFYAPADTPDTTGQRILDQTPLFGDDCALGGWAASYVQGVDWLDGIDPHTGKKFLVDIISTRAKRRSTKSVRYRESRLDGDDILIRHGIRVTGPLRTAFDAARWAPNLEEAVVALDAMLAFRTIGLRQFGQYARRNHFVTGRPQARRAGILAEPGVASPWESRLRVCYRLEARLPRPLVNVPVFGLDGRLLGIPDLFDPDAGFATEYDGQGHRDRDQHHRDNIREEGLESANLTVVRSDKTDLGKDRPGLVHRLRDGRHRGTSRDRRRDTWTLTKPEWWRRKDPENLTDAERAELFG